MIKPLVLVLLNSSKLFIMETDASGQGIRIILMQGGHRIAYIDKFSGPKQQALLTYKREKIVILHAII